MESDIVTPTQLLDELRTSYRALTSEERMQVAGFLSELSCYSDEDTWQAAGHTFIGRIA